MTTTLICDCNQTMPLNAKALGEALHEDLTLHSTLCRRDAGAFQKAIQSGQDVVVACTQEQRLFGDLGQQTEGAVSPIRFVNIRETGGWSRDAAKASPTPNPVNRMTWETGMPITPQCRYRLGETPQNRPRIRNRLRCRGEVMAALRQESHCTL